jgi:protein-disulfide isomerase
VTDALYTDQARWSVDGNIEPIISRALPAADMARVRKLAAEPSIDAAVGVGIMFAQSRNIDTTPTSFIVTETGRQQRFTGVLDPAVLKDYIDRLLR